MQPFVLYLPSCTSCRACERKTHLQDAFKDLRPSINHKYLSIPCGMKSSPAWAITKECMNADLTKWVSAHLIILLPPLGLLSTAQDLLLNQTSILEVSLLSAEKMTDSVKFKTGNVHAEGPLTAVWMPACGGRSAGPTLPPPHPAASWLHGCRSARAGSSGCWWSSIAQLQVRER